MRAWGHRTRGVGEMRPEDILREDHGRIMKLLAAWQKMLGELENPKQSRHEAFAECIGLVESFIDKCHHGKEDEILFPAMESSKRPEVTSLIEGLRSEHKTGRSMLEAIELEFKAFFQPNGSAETLIQLCESYIDLLRKHVRRENAKLLPILEKCIPAEAQDQIAAHFEQYEQETIGSKNNLGLID
jgi:hemerythrin-like domain-containing protein